MYMCMFAQTLHSYMHIHPPTGEFTHPLILILGMRVTYLDPKLFTAVRGTPTSNMAQIIVHVMRRLSSSYKVLVHYLCIRMYSATCFQIF
jgi:hypothetical protein